MLRVDGACTSVSSQAAAGAAGTESGGGGESDDGGDWEMKTALEFETFVVEHYEPAVLTCDGGRSFSCCICAAQVVDSGGALERHVAWHETLMTTNATYVMRSPQS